MIGVIPADMASIEWPGPCYVQDGECAVTKMYSNSNYLCSHYFFASVIIGGGFKGASCN